MSTLAIDTYKLLTALKGTGKNANFTAEEIANAVNVAQEGADLLTKSDFAVGMASFAARMDAFDTKLEAFRAEIKAEIKAEVRASQFQVLLWLSGIVLVSNGAVIGLLARATHVF